MKGSNADLDSRMRLAAFEQIRHLEAIHDHIPWAKIDEGFLFEGLKISLVSRPRGIFKPKEMESLLSIRTVIPRTGRSVWYEDQIDVHRKFSRTQNQSTTISWREALTLPRTDGFGKRAKNGFP